ncbi:lanthionine synthetase C family protein [Streptomyces sp. NPDC085932]|uniref:lanthionine synthetase C family protein n=1 Tax=Streptomyces sp. NPDC085932 TaxID=3365741 RepID=UPI0037D2D3DD
MSQSPALGTETMAMRAAEKVVERVASRLAQPSHMQALASRAETRIEAAYGYTVWHPLSLATGFPGPALLYGELARRDRAYRPVAHRHLSRAVQALPEPAGAGLFHGPAALLAAAQTCAGPDGDYASLRAALAQSVASMQLRRLDAVRRRTAQVTTVSEYDLFNGVSGTTRLLLDSFLDPAENTADVARAVAQSLRYLIALTRPAPVHGRQVPGWWLPASDLFTERDRGLYPEGFFDTGMAHGITGVLAVLCSALEYGHELPGQRTAISTIAEWLSHWLPTGPHEHWPDRVGFQEQVTGSLRRRTTVQSAWCYGTPAVAVALYRAGRLLDEPRWRQRAVATLRIDVARRQERWGLDGATMCHGFAGFLQTVTRVARDCADAELLAGCHRIATAVLAETDEDAPFLFRHTVRSGNPDAPVRERADRAGLLEGAAGVACALLDLTRHPLPTPADRPWDRCFGLA